MAVNVKFLQCLHDDDDVDDDDGDDDDDDDDDEDDDVDDDDDDEDSPLHWPIVDRCPEQLAPGGFDYTFAASSSPSSSPLLPLSSSSS